MQKALVFVLPLLAVHGVLVVALCRRWRNGHVGRGLAVPLCTVGLLAGVGVSMASPGIASLGHAGWLLVATAAYPPVYLFTEWALHPGFERNAD